jgi:hypothetical protein
VAAEVAMQHCMQVVTPRFWFLSKPSECPGKKATDKREGTQMILYDFSILTWNEVGCLRWHRELLEPNQNRHVESRKLPMQDALTMIRTVA